MFQRQTHSSDAVCLSGHPSLKDKSPASLFKVFYRLLRLTYIIGHYAPRLAFGTAMPAKTLVPVVRNRSQESSRGVSLTPRLNCFVRRDSHPAQLLIETNDKHRNMAEFSELDVSPAYWSIPCPNFARTPSFGSPATAQHQPPANQPFNESFFKEAIELFAMPHAGVFFTPELPHTMPAAEQPITPEGILQTTKTDQKIPHGPDESAYSLAIDSPRQERRGRHSKSKTKRLKKADQNRERNRMAAERCRVRKRDEALKLISFYQTQEDLHRGLSNEVASLACEIYHLKTQLLLHTDCNCVLIQNCIKSEASKFVEGLLTSSSASRVKDCVKSPYQRGHSIGCSPTAIGMLTSPDQQHSPSPGIGDRTYQTSFDPSERLFLDQAWRAFSHLPNTAPVSRGMSSTTISSSHL